jgi:hypothetical protein
MLPPPRFLSGAYWLLALRIKDPLLPKPTSDCPHATPTPPRPDPTPIKRPISSVLPYDGWVALMNAAIFLHCIITYQIIVNVWSASFLHILAPRWVGRLGRLGGL